MDHKGRVRGGVFRSTGAKTSIHTEVQPTLHFRELQHTLFFSSSNVEKNAFPVITTSCKNAFCLTMQNKVSWLKSEHTDKTSVKTKSAKTVSTSLAVADPPGAAKTHSVHDIASFVPLPLTHSVLWWPSLGKGTRLSATKGHLERLS